MVDVLGVEEVVEGGTDDVVLGGTLEDVLVVEVSVGGGVELVLVGGAEAGNVADVAVAVAVAVLVGELADAVGTPSVGITCLATRPFRLMIWLSTCPKDAKTMARSNSSDRVRVKDLVMLSDSALQCGNDRESGRDPQAINACRRAQRAVVVVVVLVFTLSSSSL